MRQLLPESGDVDPLRAYLTAPRPAPAGRPWVTVGMIASLDGATAISGTSGALGGPADKEVFRAVRALADVILVAAGTVRAEDYGPIRFSQEVIDARTEAGRSPEPPRLVIVTRSLDLDLRSTLFDGPGPQPLVVTTTDADQDRVDQVRARAEVRQLGAGSVDLDLLMTSLADDGVGIVVSEGGPSLNGALVAAGLVDEWCVNISPVVAGGESSRITAGAPPVGDDCALASLLSEDGLLFGRWVRTT